MADLADGAPVRRGQGALQLSWRAACRQARAEGVPALARTPWHGARPLAVSPAGEGKP